MTISDLTKIQTSSLYKMLNWPIFKRTKIFQGQTTQKKPKFKKAKVATRVCQVPVGSLSTCPLSHTVHTNPLGWRNRFEEWERLNKSCDLLREALKLVGWAFSEKLQMPSCQMQVPVQALRSPSSFKGCLSFWKVVLFLFFKVVF